MGTIDNIKDIAKLVQAAGDTELYRKIIDLQAEVVGLQGEIVALNQDLSRVRKDRDKLQKALSISATMKHDPDEGVVYMDGDASPYCAHCWESAQIAVHLKPPHKTSVGTNRDCPRCQQKFTDRRTASTRRSSTWKPPR